MGRQARILRARKVLRQTLKTFGYPEGLYLAQAQSERFAELGPPRFARALRRTMRELMTGHRSIQTIARRYCNEKRVNSWNLGEVTTWAAAHYRETGHRV